MVEVRDNLSFDIFHNLSWQSENKWFANLPKRKILGLATLHGKFTILKPILPRLREKNKSLPFATKNSRKFKWVMLIEHILTRMQPRTNYPRRMRQSQFDIFRNLSWQDVIEKQTVSSRTKLPNLVILHWKLTSLKPSLSRRPEHKKSLTVSTENQRPSS